MTRLSDTFFPDGIIVDLLSLEQLRAHDDSTAYMEIYPEVCDANVFWSNRSVYIHDSVWDKLMKNCPATIDKYDITSFEPQSIPHLVAHLQKQREIHDSNDELQLSLILTKLIAWLQQCDRGVMFLGL